MRTNHLMRLLSDTDFVKSLITWKLVKAPHPLVALKLVTDPLPEKSLTATTAGRALKKFQRTVR